MNALNLGKKQAILLTAGDNDIFIGAGGTFRRSRSAAADKASMYDIWKSRAVHCRKIGAQDIEKSFAGAAQEKPEVEHIAVPA